MKDGIYKDLSISDYHGNKTHISSTAFRKSRRSLKEFKWFLDNKKKQEHKTCFDFGNAFEVALIDKDNFDNEVAIKQNSMWVDEALTEKPELTVPKNSKFYKGKESEFIKKNNGKYFIDDVGNESFETIEYMLTSCYSDSTIMSLINNTVYQTSIFWTDEVTGLQLKTRPDCCKLSKNVIIDVKTCKDGSPEGFSKAISDYDLHFQACMQIDGALQSGYMPNVDKYFWLAVEKVEPYNATIYEFTPEDIKWSMDEYTYVKEMLKKAKDEDKYPGYTQRADNKFGILEARIPMWIKPV